jgi:hypothetical protein
LSPFHNAEAVKTGGELVAPGAVHPALGRPVLELGEVGRDAAHVGRAAKNDGVGAVQLGLAGLRLSDRHEGHFGAGDGLGPLGDSLGQSLGVAEARVVNDGNGRHDLSNPLI